MSETWNSLSKAVREIHNHNASNLSFEENYRFAYNLVLHKQGDLLYRGVNDLITENINKLAEEKVKPCFPTTVSGDPAQKGQEVERFLRAVRDSWDDHIGSMSKLRDILKYMVRLLVNKTLRVLMEYAQQGPCVYPKCKRANDLGCRNETLFEKHDQVPD